MVILHWSSVSTGGIQTKLFNIHDSSISIPIQKETKLSYLYWIALLVLAKLAKLPSQRPNGVHPSFSPVLRHRMMLQGYNPRKSIQT